MRLRRQIRTCPRRFKPIGATSNLEKPGYRIQSRIWSPSIIQSTGDHCTYRPIPWGAGPGPMKRESALRNQVAELTVNHHPRQASTIHIPNFHHHTRLRKHTNRRAAIRLA